MSKRPSKAPEQEATTEQQKDKKVDQKANQLAQDVSKNKQKGAPDANQKSNSNLPQQQQGKLQVPAANQSQQQGQSSKTSLDAGDKKRSSIEQSPASKSPQLGENDKKQAASSLKLQNDSISSQSQLDGKFSGRDSNPSLVMQQSDLTQGKAKAKNPNSKQPGIIVTGEKDQQQQPPVEVKPEKSNILNESGLVDAYDYFLRQLCKNGLPTGNIFEYAAQQIIKFEKKKKQDIQKKQYKTGSPLNRTSVHSPKGISQKGDTRNDSIEKDNKGIKDSQFSKEANLKKQQDQVPQKQEKQGKQPLQKDSKIVEEKKVVSKDKVREDSPEKKKQGEKEDKSKQQQQQQPAPTAAKGKK